MRSVCCDCDLGLKRSDCTNEEYIECECRRWFSERFKYEDLTEKTVWFIENILDVKLRQEKCGVKEHIKFFIPHLTHILIYRTKIIKEIKK